MKLFFLFAKRLVCLVLLVSFISSCQPYKPPLTVAAAPWPNYEFLFLAKQLNYLNPEQFSLFELPSSTSVTQAFQTGKLDVAFLSLDEVLTLVALGIDLKIISVIDQSVGGDSLLAKPEIKKLQDLKWRSIGYENKAAGALLLDEMMSLSGLNNQTIQLYEVKQNEVKDAYMQGNIDALIVREPQKQQLLELGAVELLNSSILEQRITHLIVTREDSFYSKEEQITELLKRFYKAQEYYKENPKDALTTMSVRLQVYPYLLEKSFSGTLFIEPRDALMRLSGSPSNIELQASQLSKFMTAKNMLGKIPSNFNSLISTRILERVIYE
ncbi:ABC transporter substrate-binding protein [Psychromonas aquimarina]|uniref:ABC transporter substrate-binding protein n=1 Tax=Psychromonas aquimarina TaxID=444919 RepID=UPI00041FEF72|nr:ABC transporter substrate-binding protein [Psychromonas aquimarina]